VNTEVVNFDAERRRDLAYRRRAQVQLLQLAAASGDYLVAQAARDRIVELDRGEA
jgi:hypothetical protein